MHVDHWVAALFVPLALWFLLSGIDDFAICLAAVAAYVRQAFSRTPKHRIATEAELDSVPQRRMAIFVALWKEHRVIRRMLENNIAQIRYGAVDFFVGCYPNDAPTLAAVREAMKLFPNVHLSLCPHHGPTSKADCLNWIYQRMLLHEEEHAVRFEMILTHDAEDLIDPDALRWINYYAQWNDMVQIPVLALPTPWREIAHGVYCDEFAEFQFRDMMARQLLGGFIPSNGVGTGFSRHALERLAEAYSNRIFEPGCLTEDYENGFRVRALGLPQKFIPIQFRHGRPIATREFFPRTFGTAVRQRSRWATGISLQSWELHSLRETLRHGYWFWRDRKSLAGNLVTPLTNLVFLYGAVTLAWAEATHRPWGLGQQSSMRTGTFRLTLALQALQMAIRTWCSARIYGWRFACAVPLRAVAGNCINCFATCKAIGTYAAARLRGHPLRWAKTDHAYPNRAALLVESRSLGEILTGSQWIEQQQLDAALASKPAARRLSEHLLLLGLVTEADLYAALSLQHNLPLGKPAAEEVFLPVTRALPLALVQKWKVLPFRIAAGELYVAASNPPEDEMQQDIRRFSSLELRFQLVTPTEFEEMAGQYLS